MISEGELTATFDDRPVTYSFGELDTLVPAYAATIHKSQGSEYPAVVIPVMMVEDRAVVAAGLVAERTGKPTLADAGFPDDQQVLMTLDPIAGDEFCEQRLVEGARQLSD